MAIALVPNQTANVSQATSTTATVTLPQAPVAGNLVVVIGTAGGENSATTATAKDGNSNVLTATPSTPHWDVGGLVVYFCFFMVAPPNASKSVTVTLGSSSSSIRVYIGEFSGASGFCEQDKYANSLANGTVINYPPIQTRANGDLIVALGSSPSSISTPATSFPYTQLSTVLSFNLAVEFYVQPMAGAIAPYFNQGSGGFSAMIAAFTPSQPFPFSQGIPKSLAMLFGAPAVTSFSMTAATGNYTLAGENLALLKKSIDNIQSGSYALTDEQLTLKKASKLNVQETPYTLTGEQITALKKSVLNIQEVPYTTSSQPVFRKTSKQNIQEVPYTLTVEAETTKKGYADFPQSGTYALTGEQITALKKSLDKLQTGTYTTSSQPALKKTSVLNVRETSYSLNVGAGIDDARSFNGTSDTISLPNVSTLDVTTQLSLSAWIYITGNPAFGSQQTVIANGNLSGRNFILDYRNSGTTVIELSNTVVGSFGELRAATGTISNNAWHQLIFTVDWTQNPWTANCWLDGISQSVSNVGAVTSGTPDASDTKRSIGSVNSAAFWNGNLADIAVWNGHLLTAGEVSNLAAGRRANTVASGSLVGYWPILGQSPEPDKSGNGDDGTLTGTAVVAGPPALDPFGVTILGYETLLWDHLTKGQTGFYSLTGENEKLTKTSANSLQTGFYSLTGESITFTIPAGTFTISIGAGTYTLTDESLTLTKASKAGVQTGVYNLTDEQLTLLKASKLVGSSGFYTLTGEQLTLKAARLANAQSGSYALTGENEKLLKTSKDSAQTGFYNLTGENETLKRAASAFPQAGFYNVTGENETLRATRLLNAQMTPYNLTVESLSLTIPGNFSMSIGSGAYTLTDNNLTLTKTSKLFASAVTYALTVEQLALLKASKDFPQTGFYTATDENVTLKATHRLNAAEGSYSLTDEALALNAAHLAKAQSGSYSLTGNNERLLKSSLLSVQEGAYTLTVEQVRELWKHFNQIQTGYYNLTGESLTLSQIIGAFSMLLQTGNYSLTGENVTIQITTPVVVNIAALISLLGSEVGGTLLGSEIGGALLGNEIVSALLGNELGGTLLGNEIVTSVLGAAVLAPIPTLHFVMHPQTGTYSVDG